MSKTGQIVEQLGLWLCLFMLSYQFIIFVWGRYGLLAHRKLLEVQNELEAHYQTIQKHQDELLAIADQIYSDSSYIALEARNLGYYRKNDKLILLNSWFQAHPAPSPGDRMLVEAEPSQGRILGIWLYASFLASFCWFVIHLLYSGGADLLPRNISNMGFSPKYRVRQHDTNTRKTMNGR